MRLWKEDRKMKNIAMLKNENGFTLLELMISMTIMAVAFLGILPLFFYSQAQLKEATLTTLAMNVIQEKMDRITGLDYELIDYQDDPFDDVNSQYVYILPEVFTKPCTDYATNPCGWHGAATENKLMDIVEVSGYYFTRYIDIDEIEDSGSWEPDDYVTPHSIDLSPHTKRITITVYWTVPGGKQHFVQATTEVYDIRDRL